MASNIRKVIFSDRHSEEGRIWLSRMLLTLDIDASPKPALQHKEINMKIVYMHLVSFVVLLWTLKLR